MMFGKQPGQPKFRVLCDNIPIRCVVLFRAKASLGELIAGFFTTVVPLI
jgi:hypothetical protein